ncbi:hypothetical protein JIG36_32130 [Actinoplanes sp. LDG1-06]|uniref:Uncharacterized protein n=1 Tax=Paractinoplanes ovalisporus TaxID=2810368 RepID=A0ABS2AK07_9ACTN|nr:hypothetical protein [Actinoplanes ovalisporus]MBM2620173.1 hypothetical protein [Actinoplanes ovalisporus]
MSGEFILDRRFAERWQAAGLGGELVDILDGHSKRRAELREQEDADRTGARKSERDRVRSLVTGAPAKAKIATPGPGWDFRAAHREIDKAAMRAVRDLGDRLITEHLAPAYEALLDEAADLAPLVDGLRNDSDVVRRSTSDEAREAWLVLGELWTRRERLVELLWALVSDRAVPLIFRREGVNEERLLRFPSRGLPPVRFGTVPAYDSRAPKPSGARLMADLVIDEHGRHPGIFTAGEAAANADQDLAEAAEAREAALAEEQAAWRAARDAHRAKRDERLEVERATEQRLYEESYRDSVEHAALRAHRAGRTPRRAEAPPPLLDGLRSGYRGGSPDAA